MAAGVLALWLLGVVRRRWAKFVFRRTLRDRQRRAQHGERRAEDLLVQHGWTIVDSQVHLLWPVFVDDERVEVRLIADFIVEHDGVRFVAEVKTGEAAPSVKVAATRRQLLEYLVAFDCDGVLLVDMEAEEIRAVHFGED